MYLDTCQFFSLTLTKNSRHKKGYLKYIVYFSRIIGLYIIIQQSK